MKPFSLLGLIVSDGQKKFYNIGHQVVTVGGGADVRHGEVLDFVDENCQSDDPKNDDKVGKKIGLSSIVTNFFGRRRQSGIIS